MKKKFSLILLAVLLVLVMATCVACGDPDEPTPPTPDTPTTYTVTLDMQDGSTPTTQTVEAGGKVTFPSVDNTAYKSFKGWYKDAEGTQLWSKSTAVTEDVTIYACWNQKYGAVVYNMNYDGAESVTERLPLGETIVFMADPEREYYVFAGWFTDKACTKPCDNNLVITKNETKLYAKWTLDPTHVHEYTTTTVPMTCDTDGYDVNTCPCGDTYNDNIVPARGHKFSFDENDYFGMVECDYEDCEHHARQESLNIYADKFVYNFDEDKAAEITARYDEIVALLESVEKYDQAIHAYEKPSALWDENQAFEVKFNAFYDDLMYLVEQYQYAYVFYCVNTNANTTAAYDFVTEFRTNAISDFYKLYRMIYETKFREYFYDKHEGGWTDEDIDQALTMSDSYGGEEYAALNTRIHEIEVEHEEIKNQDTDKKVLELYEEFVSLQNQLARLAGYDNYPEYAYANVYDREYSPEDVALMRGYVKEHLTPVYTSILNGYLASSNAGGLLQGTIESEYFNALTEDSIFNSNIATDLVGEYFKKMASTTAGEQEIDFYHHANELFKNGNYYTGTYEGAYNYWIPAQETSILYFGPDSYSGAFTFVHEFGHYYSDVYNKGISYSYDLAETHSQGNEMLFLSFLEDALPKSILRKIYDKVYYDNLFNMFAIVMLATAVDEFEYCVYTGTAPDGTPATYTAKDYDGLFSQIMGSYGIRGSLNESYWRYVTIPAPSYYISYAMSALPCVELLSVAETEGFEAAQAIYFKLFTFTEDDANVEIDEAGDTIIKIGYGETLEYIGLHSIFDENLYTTLHNYFCNMQKDFTYPDAE